MSLEARNAHSIDPPKSEEAAQGIVDHRTPGSFPIEDDIMQSTQESQRATMSATGSSHNKLHKPNDPRGLPDMTPGGLGHSRGDSEGVMDPQVQSYTHEPAKDEQNTSSHGYGRQTSSSGHEGLTKKEEQDLSTANMLGSSAGTTSTSVSGEGHNTVRSGLKGSGSAAHSEPYWGDLPRGAGVYNTVAGHGSAEDERRQIHGGDNKPNPIAADSTNTGAQEEHQQHQQQRSFPLASRQKDDSEFPKPQEAQRLDDDRERSPQQHQQHRDQSGSRYKDTAAAAAAPAALAGAAAAYHNSQNRDKDEADRKQREDAAAAAEHRNAEEKKSGGGGGVFGLFHRRGSKSERKSSDETHETKDKHQQQAKDEHGHKSGGGLFKRKSHEEKHAERQDQSLGTESDDHSRRNEAALGLGAAGAGAGAASAGYYAATHNRKDDKDNMDEASRVRQAATTSGAQQQTNRDGYGHLSSGTPSGIAATGTGSGPGASSTDRSPISAHGAAHARTASGPNDGYGHLSSGTPSGIAGASSAAGAKDGPAASSAYTTNTSGTLAPGTSSETARDAEGRDQSGHRYGAMAGTAAGLAGLSAGARVYGSRRDGDHGSRPETYDGTTTSGSGSGVGSGSGSNTAVGPATSRAAADPLAHDQEQQHHHHHTAGQAAAAATPAALASSLSSHHSQQQRAAPNPEGDSSSFGPKDTTSQPEPAMTQRANHGQYNVLASGTPSGVRLDDGPSSGTRGSKSADLTTSPATARESSNRSATTAATGAGAAALGGAAYYAARDRDDGRGKEQQGDKANYPGAPAREHSTAVGGAGTGLSTSKVIHHCTKCGEANDISSYLHKDKQ